MSKTARGPLSGLAKPIGLSLVGAAIVAPVPLMSGNPKALPASLLELMAGVPLLNWGLVLMMGLLIVVALLASNAVDGTDN